ncbi:beta-galactosidase [Nonomuraea sp. NBC_00507]|uniref:beta-galactosidase n=1 Tax=Nonomuraea sp. NBC_00507 TaxID=2976002 RepID=UPI002E187E00
MLITAEYPYFRDRPEVWRDRLTTLVAATGVKVVTTYIPWRHHQPDAAAPPDLTDAVDFVRLCGELGLKVIVKPGPFVHAELNYGGLPDWVCPLADPAIEPQLDADGAPATWSGSELDADGSAVPWPLPAPLGSRFAALAERWLRDAGQALFTPDLVTPAGPIIGSQIGNEGLFTNGARPLSAYDYSTSGLEFFRTVLAREYGDVAGYNARHGTAYTTLAEIEPPRGPATPLQHVDWGRFHTAYLQEVLRRWTDAFAPPVPVVLNLNPPAGDDGDLDSWLARVRPETWNGLQYGFTNWMGVVSADRSAHARYVIAAKRAAGPNMEENWGFSKLYDTAYASGATSFHQTLLALAAGATGFNIYTAIATTDWTPALDAVLSAPYPDCPPIDGDGRPTAKAAAVKMLADYFTLHGTEYLEGVPVTYATWGLYTPYAAIGAWSPGAAEQCGRPLLDFHHRMRAAGHDYRIVDLEHADLAGHDRIALHGGQFMHRAVQEKLAAHLAAGGHVHLEGTEPLYDEHGGPCTILADALRRTAPADLSAEDGVTVLSGVADAYLRIHPDHDVCYVTVLVQNDSDPLIELELRHRGRTHQIEIVAARGGAAVLRVVAGRLDDHLVKATNSHLGSAVSASIRFDGEHIAAPASTDLCLIGGSTLMEENAT